MVHLLSDMVGKSYSQYITIFITCQVYFAISSLDKVFTICYHKIMIKPIDSPQPKQKRMTKKIRQGISRRKYTLYTVAFITSCLLVFTGADYFFDRYDVGYQNPISIKVQSPISVSTRRVLNPVVEGAITPTSTPMSSPTVTPTVAPIKKKTKVGMDRRYDYKSVVSIMSDTQKQVMSMVEARFGEEGARVVYKESSFNPEVVNPNGGACGLFQAYPCSKMKCELSDISCQLDWGEQYMINRYGSPEKALEFHLANNWY